MLVGVLINLVVVVIFYKYIKYVLVIKLKNMLIEVIGRFW